MILKRIIPARWTMNRVHADMQQPPFTNTDYFTARRWCSGAMFERP